MEIESDIDVRPHRIANRAGTIDGVAQVFVRPHAPNESLAAKLINRSTITALFAVAVGVCGLLVGLGVVKMPHFR